LLAQAMPHGYVIVVWPNSAAAVSSFRSVVELAHRKPSFPCMEERAMEKFIRNKNIEHFRKLLARIMHHI
jgi:hypothetical protein